MHLNLNNLFSGKRKALFTLLLICSATILCSSQSVKPEDYGRYHPLTPKIDRMANLDPIPVSTDKGENAFDRAKHLQVESFLTEAITTSPSWYLFLYKNRKFDKIKAVTMLKNTTLLVVIDDEQTEIKNALNKAFSIYWKFNNYKFISRSEVQQYTEKKEYSYFMFARDEHFIAQLQDLQVNYIKQNSNGSADRRIVLNSWNPPHLFYKSDSMQNTPTQDHNSQGEFRSTYMFLLCVRNKDGAIKTKEEDVIMDQMSIADYILTQDPTVKGSSGLDYSFDKAGTLMQRERDVIPQINTIVANLEDDMEYMYKTQSEYIAKRTCVNQVSKCHLLYNGSKVELKLNLFAYNTTFKKALKDKTIYINSSITDELGKDLIACATGLDKGNVKMAPKSEIDSLINMGSGNDNVLVFQDLTPDCYGFYQISTTLGEEVLGLEPRRTTDALGTFDLLGTDAWSDRKKVSVITK